MLQALDCPQLLNLTSLKASPSRYHRAPANPHRAHTDVRHCWRAASPLCRASAAEAATGAGPCKTGHFAEAQGYSVVSALSVLKHCLPAGAEEAAGARSLQGAEAELWREALQRVQALGFEELDADNILRKAFGWSGQGYWRKSKEYEVPQPGQV